MSTVEIGCQWSIYGMVSMNDIKVTMILDPNVQGWHGVLPSQGPRKRGSTVLSANGEFPCKIDDFCTRYVPREIALSDC